MVSIIDKILDRMQDWGLVLDLDKEVEKIKQAVSSLELIKQEIDNMHRNNEYKRKLECMLSDLYLSNHKEYENIIGGVIYLLENKSSCYALGLGVNPSKEEIFEVKLAIFARLYQCLCKQT